MFKFKITVDNVIFLILMTKLTFLSINQFKFFFDTIVFFEREKSRANNTAIQVIQLRKREA